MGRMPNMNEKKNRQVSASLNKKAGILMWKLRNSKQWKNFNFSKWLSHKIIEEFDALDKQGRCAEEVILEHEMKELDKKQSQVGEEMRRVGERLQELRRRRGEDSVGWGESEA